MLPKKLFKNPNNPLEGEERAAQVSAPNVPDKLCEACPGCKGLIFTDALKENLDVCPKCGHHFRIAPRTRIGIIADAGSFAETDAELESQNLLGFPGYDEKLEAARRKSGEKSSVITGTATIGGMPCALFVMNQDFMMGSMGTVAGEKITRLFELATKKGLPVVGFTVSGGARMQEGILSLMQMAKTSGAVRRHSDAGLLYLCVLTDPTTGGVTASFAMEADITLAEPGALVAFAGPRVIEQTIHKTLPEGFQRSEFLMDHGFVDIIAPRGEQKALIAKLLKMHAGEGWQ